MSSSSSSPFTSSQWEELQRQAVNYEHIIASATIPSSLLSPLSALAIPNPPTINFAPSSSSDFSRNKESARFGNGAEDEPGRCRRTDGKKWRCARNAEVDQKYCLRHLHRGSSRSRKHVEHQFTQTRCKSTDVVSPSGVGSSLELSLPFAFVHTNYQSSYSDWRSYYSETVGDSNIGFNVEYKSNHCDGVPTLNHFDHDPNVSCCSYLNSDPLEEEMCITKYYEEQPNISTTAPANSCDSSDVSSMDKLSLSMGLGGPLAEAFQSSKRC